MLVQNKRIILILLSVPLLLLLPFIAMQYTSQVNWSPADFLAMAILLLGTGLICELVLRVVKNQKYRIILVVAFLAMLLLIWAELAVGIFGTPFAGS